MEWVQEIYDDQDSQERVEWVNGVLYCRLSRTFLESGHPSISVLPIKMQAPWGTYPSPNEVQK
jgi:hypothetical protein